LVLAASRIVISGNHMLRRLKHSKIEVLVPEEEDGVIGSVSSVGSSQ